MVDIARLSQLKNRAQDVMARRPSRRARKTRTIRTDCPGPGKLLRRRLKSWGVKPGCAGCDDTAKKMDELGPDGCHARRAELAREILPRARDWAQDVPGFRQALGFADRVGIGDTVLLGAIDSVLLGPVIQQARRNRPRAHVDVLLIVSAHGTQWKEDQTGFLDLLEAAGLTAQATSIEVLSDLRDALAESSPRICIIRALPMTAEELRPIAAALPDVRFLMGCHSLPSHLVVWKGGVEKFTGYVRVANELPNVWLATPDERQPWSSITKSLWLPNSVAPVEPADPGPIVGPVDLSLVCRRDTVKNVPNQILAAAAAHRQRPCRLHLMMRGESSDFRALAEACGLPVMVHDWLPHDQHRRRLAQLIDVGLQSGFCESFNYVALEHLMCGIPVVGSEAIRFLPDSLRADPNDVDALAELILSLAAEIDRDPPAAHATCVALGRDVADRINAALVDALKGLL